MRADLPRRPAGHAPARRLRRRGDDDAGAGTTTSEPTTTSSDPPPRPRPSCSRSPDCPTRATRRCCTGRRSWSRSTTPMARVGAAPGRHQPGRHRHRGAGRGQRHPVGGRLPLAGRRPGRPDPLVPDHRPAHRGQPQPAAAGLVGRQRRCSPRWRAGPARRRRLRRRHRCLPPSEPAQAPHNLMTSTPASCGPTRPTPAHRRHCSPTGGPVVGWRPAGRRRADQLRRWRRRRR